ncbi:MAG: hypothetical protein ABF653_09655 [Bifidobacterium aquikefiri]|uniref:hypothetical protein n=1 Tax=Bifidobacterium aquikefiri TaxID=1653207 RepID=UPI0039EB3FCD
MKNGKFAEWLNKRPREVSNVKMFELIYIYHRSDETLKSVNSFNDLLSFANVKSEKAKEELQEIWDNFEFYLDEGKVWDARH